MYKRMYAYKHCIRPAPRSPRGGRRRRAGSGVVVFSRYSGQPLTAEPLLFPH